MKEITSYNKKTLKTFIALFLITALMFTNIAFATNTSANVRPATNAATPQQTEGVVQQATDGSINLKVINDGKINNTSTNASIINITRNILEILQLIGICVGLVMLMIIGIKFVVSIGKDAPDKKQVIINYIFGAILIFGATGILTVIQKLVEQFQQSI